MRTIKILLDFLKNLLTGKWYQNVETLYTEKLALMRFHKDKVIFWVDCLGNIYMSYIETGFNSSCIKLIKFNKIHTRLPESWMIDRVTITISYGGPVSHFTGLENLVKVFHVTTKELDFNSTPLDLDLIAEIYEKDLKGLQEAFSEDKEKIYVSDKYKERLYYYNQNRFTIYNFPICYKLSQFILKIRTFKNN